MAIIKSKRPLLLGDTPASSSTSVSDIADNPNVKLAAGVALGYHGYRRTGSVFWALVYAAAGRWFPLEAVPIAVAQGYGQKKGGGS